MSETARIVSIDSLPVKSSIFDTWDYSGYQVHLLSNTPLAKFAKEQVVQQKGLSHVEIRVPSHLRWSDGQPVLASEYQAGIQRVTSRHAIIRNLLMHSVRRMSAQADLLLIELNSWGVASLDWIQILNFCPLRASSSELSSGKYCLVEMNGGDYLFTKNPHALGISERLLVRHVQSPLKNLEGYFQHLIDITSDTAFPFEYYEEFRKRSDFYESDTGLLVEIIFGKSLSSEESLGTRIQLHRAISGLSDDASISGRLPKKLILAYDDFYPNREICEDIRSEFARRGCEVELAQDDYYAPFRHFDLRLRIRRAPGTTPILKYSSFVFEEVLKGSPDLMKWYVGKLLNLHRVECDPKESESELETFLIQNVVYIPLFSLPSIYLNRSKAPNPLLTHLEVCS